LAAICSINHKSLLNKEWYLTLGIDPRYDQVHVAYNIDF